MDLQDLARPNLVLGELAGAIEPTRVLILGALGSVATTDIKRLGLRLVARPVVIEEVVATVKRILKTR